jgi:hypothetical protein
VNKYWQFKTLIRKVPDSEVMRGQYEKIISGLKELRDLDDPDIGLIYTQIDNVLAKPQVSISDLYQIESAISKNKKHMLELSDLVLQQDLKNSQ